MLYTTVPPSLYTTATVPLSLRYCAPHSTLLLLCPYLYATVPLSFYTAATVPLSLRYCAPITLYYCYCAPISTLLCPYHSTLLLLCPYLYVTVPLSLYTAATVPLSLRYSAPIALHYYTPIAPRVESSPRPLPSARCRRVTARCFRLSLVPDCARTRRNSLMAKKSPMQHAHVPFSHLSHEAYCTTPDENMRIVHSIHPWQRWFQHATRLRTFLTRFTVPLRDENTGTAVYS